MEFKGEVEVIELEEDEEIEVIMEVKNTAQSDKILTRAYTDVPKKSNQTKSTRYKVEVVEMDEDEEDDVTISVNDIESSLNISRFQPTVNLLGSLNKLLRKENFENIFDDQKNIPIDDEDIFLEEFNDISDVVLTAYEELALRLETEQKENTKTESSVEKIPAKHSTAQNISWSLEDVIASKTVQAMAIGGKVESEIDSFDALDFLEISMVNKDDDNDNVEVVGESTIETKMKKSRRDLKPRYHG